MWRAAKQRLEARMRLYDIKELGELVLSKGNDKISEITVVIPLFNYEWAITWCLESLRKQVESGFSVIIVDDCSSDNGLKVVVDWIDKNWRRFCRIQVVRHMRNQGLSMARNTGIAWTDDPLLFMLDADNELRPAALRRLKEALEASNSEFAYSHLWQIGDANCIAYADVWDPKRLKLGNYIDAMAMIKRTALLAANGYAVVGDDLGWEDYDLWCRFAALGYSGVFVPEVLGYYRVHGSSMVHTTSIPRQDILKSEMALRHPELVNF